MNQIRIVSVAILAVAMGACSSSSDASNGASAADFGAARAKLTGKPTGALTKATANRVATGMRHDSESGKSGLSLGPTGGSGGSGGGLETQGMHFLSAGLSTCDDVEAGKDVGSCACESGSLDYDIPHLSELRESKDLPDQLDMNLKFDACRMNGHTADGTLAIELTKPSDMLFVMNMSLDEEKVSLAFAMKHGELWYSQDVDADGNYVLVKLGSYEKGNGSYDVLAKNGEYACSIDDGEGSCEPKDGGDSIDVKEESDR